MPIIQILYCSWHNHTYCRITKSSHAQLLITWLTYCINTYGTYRTKRLSYIRTPDLQKCVSKRIKENGRNQTEELLNSLYN